MKKQILALPVAILLSISLAACGGSSDKQSASGSSDKQSASGSDSKAKSAPANQSVADACKIAEDKMNSFSEKYADSAQTAATDPEKGIALLKEMSAELNSVTDSISNADVLEAWTGFTASFEKLNTATADQDITALTDVTQEMMDSATKLGEVCDPSAK